MAQLSPHGCGGPILWQGALHGGIKLALTSLIFFNFMVIYTISSQWLPQDRMCPLCWLEIGGPFTQGKGLCPSYSSQRWTENPAAQPAAFPLPPVKENKTAQKRENYHHMWQNLVRCLGNSGWFTWKGSHSFTSAPHSRSLEAENSLSQRYTLKRGKASHQLSSSEHSDNIRDAEEYI